MLSDMASLSYDIGVLVEGQHYLHTWEMGPVEGDIEVLVDSSEEDLEDLEEEEEEEEDEEDMTLKE